MKVDHQPFRSEKRVAEILNCFEKEHGLFGYAVYGVSVWQILRFSIASDLQNLPLKRIPLARSTLIKHSLIGVLDLIKLIITGKKSDYWVSTYVSALRLRRGEYYQDIYFDALLANVRSGLKIQAVNAAGYDTQQKNAFIKPDIDGAFFSIVAEVFARLFPVRNDQGVFCAIANLINKELELANYSEKKIRMEFSSMYWRSHGYTALLRLLKPRVIFVADTGEYSLLLACRNQGVSFIELQHGIQTPDHPASLPLVALEYEGNLLLPSHLGVFGDYWKSLLADTALGKKERIYIVGSDTIDYYRELRSGSFVANPISPVLTLTTQGIDIENLINFIREFLRVCDSAFTLNIKLHPAYDNSMDMYIDAFGEDARCKVIAGKSDPNTYELIALSDLHLSIASACHYDALGLGVPTVVMGLTGYQLMEDLVAKGDALIAMIPADLANIVKNQRWGAVSNEKSERYLKRGFIRNVSELAKIGEYAGC